MTARGYVEVTQADRDAAADNLMLSNMPSPRIEAVAVRSGEDDHHSRVQAFARHRIAHTDTHVLIQKGMRLSALICGDLAETIYNDGDEFKAATGCESAIMKAAAEYRAPPECAPSTDALAPTPHDSMKGKDDE
jgi:hypothetical protein